MPALARAVSLAAALLALPLAARAASGQIAFRQAGKAVTLPAATISISKQKFASMPSPMFMVELLFQKQGSQDRALLGFGTSSADGTGPVSDMAVTSLGFFVGEVRSAVQMGKLRCNLTVTAVSETAVSGKASCTGLVDPMKGNAAAPDVTEIAFEARS